jgi:hypothetical protein
VWIISTKAFEKWATIFFQVAYEYLRSGALVFFGVTGDLAYKKIFPALQRSAAEIRRRSAIAENWRELWTKLPVNLIVCSRHRACWLQR